MTLLDQLLAGADQAEVVELRSELTTVGFEANRLKSSRVDETQGTAVRVVKGGRVGFSASSDRSANDKLVANALESAAYGDLLHLAFPPAQTAPAVQTYDPAIVDLPVARLVDAGRDMVELIRQVDPEVQVNIALKRGVEHLSLRNSAGAEIAFRRSPLSVELEVSRVQGDDVLLLFEMQGATLLQGQDLLLPAQQAAEKLRLAGRRASLSSGRMPVLFTPTGALALGVPLFEALNGKNVYTHTSPMEGKTGQKLFDYKIAVADDATLDGRFGSAPFDDEGVAHRRSVLVEGGELRGFFYDLTTACKSGTESTGNGARSLFRPPAPSPTNLMIEPGLTTLAEMLASVDSGLVVEIPLGLGQGNVVSGAFSNSLGLAFKIEKGEIVGRVKDVSIAGNIYELLREVTAVSRESEWVFYNYRLPYILLPDMNVVGKE